MPVFPAVGSIINEPGSRTPRRSASRIIPSAARSFTDPPGFMYSSLAKSSAAGGGANLDRRSSGVPPTSSRMFSTALSGARSPSEFLLCDGVTMKVELPMVLKNREP